MGERRGKYRWLVAGIIVIGGALPLVGYWAMFERVPTVDPSRAKEILAEPDSSAVLVDVRPPDAYRAGHVEAAANWPAAQISALGSKDDVPERFRGKKLVLVCWAGLTSAKAAAKLRSLGADVVGVRGGMEAWIADAGPNCPLALAQMASAEGRTEGFPHQDLSRWQQLNAVVTGFVIKPTYMLLSLVLIIVLARRRSRDLVALRWGLIFFLAGETVCALNYLLFGDASRLFEYLHSFGMVASFGFVTYAVLDGIDLRIVKYSDETQTCAATGLCRGCAKHSDVPCGLKRAFYVMIPAAIVVAFMPLVAKMEVRSYNTTIYGTPYNYSHPVIYQIYETRYLPVAAVVLFAASFLVLLVKKREPVALSKVLFAAGAGALGFSFLRFFTFAAYRDDLVWYVFWEEATEFLFIVGAGCLLWIFRAGLFRSEASTRAVEEAQA